MVYMLTLHVLLLLFCCPDTPPSLQNTHKHRYIRMARTPGDGNDCGVTTDPVLAVVHPDHVKAGSAAAQLIEQLNSAQQQKEVVHSSIATY